MPFSYSEFLNYYDINGLKYPDKPLHNYIRYGGMPQRVDYETEEDIKEYLKSIYYGIVDKDICNTKAKINKETFLTISKYIINNASKEFSVPNIVDYYNQNNTDKIYCENVYRYLEKLEKACLISRVKRYDIATKRTLRQIEKQFVVDNGFLLACSDSNKIFISHALENLVYNELLYRGYDVKIGKTYKGEIDFVAMKDGKKCFIQVAYMLSSDDVIEREFGASDLIAMWVADMDFECADCIKEALHKYVDDPLGYFATPQEYYETVIICLKMELRILILKIGY